MNEVLEFLAPCLGTGTIVDATVGGGGHSAAILAEMVKRQKYLVGVTQGRLVGLDVDPEAIAVAEKNLSDFGCRTVDLGEVEELKKLRAGELKEMVILVRTNYVNIAQVVEGLGVLPVVGVVMDLGISSLQLASDRGFSFDRDAPLDMRFDPEVRGGTARDVLRRAGIGELRFWLREYGGESLSARISRRIYEWKDRIKTTRDLTAAVASVVPRQGLRKRLARVFQALRIVVNRELENLREGLRAAVDILAPRGRLLVICYQSGEDRCFKQVIREKKERLRLVTPKAIRPSAHEVKSNPRARSARLRVVERV